MQLWNFSKTLTKLKLSLLITASLTTLCFAENALSNPSQGAPNPSIAVDSKSSIPANKAAMPALPATAPTVSNPSALMPLMPSPTGTTPPVFQDMKMGHYHPENIEDAIKHAKNELKPLQDLAADNAKMSALKPEKKAKFKRNLAYALADLEYLEARVDKKYYWSFGKLMRHVNQCNKILKWSSKDMAKEAFAPSPMLPGMPPIQQPMAPIMPSAQPVPAAPASYPVK